MGKRLAIPRILGIDWWWLLIIGVFEYYVRNLLHVPDWVPQLGGLWFVGQAFWLKVAEPDSKSIYWCTVAYVAVTFTVALEFLFHAPNWTRELDALSPIVLWVVTSFIFRAEFAKHFNEIEPRNLKLSAPMTLFFNSLYFQYWFHQLFVEQNAQDTSIKPGLA